MALRRLGPCNVGDAQPAADHRQANSAGEYGMRYARLASLFLSALLSLGFAQTIGTSDSSHQNLRDGADGFAIVGLQAAASFACSHVAQPWKRSHDCLYRRRYRGDG